MCPSGESLLLWISIPPHARRGEQPQNISLPPCSSFLHLPTPRPHPRECRALTQSHAWGPGDPRPHMRTAEHNARKGNQETHQDWTGICEARRAGKPVFLPPRPWSFAIPRVPLLWAAPALTPAPVLQPGGSGFLLKLTLGGLTIPHLPPQSSSTHAAKSLCDISLLYLECTRLPK